MRTHVLVLTTSMLILASAATSAIAQQGAGSPMMQHPSQEQTQQQGSDQGSMAGQRGMMGPGMMGQGNMMSMMGPRGMGGGMPAPMGMMGRSFMMRIMFILMDVDGDGTVSVQEFQAAHERIFKAMDTNRDGRITFEEIQSFIQSAGGSAAHW